MISWLNFCLLHGAKSPKLISGKIESTTLRGTIIVTCLVAMFLGVIPTFLIAQNMVSNGDFESGVTGFTSDYTDFTGQINRSGCSNSSGSGNPCTLQAGQYAVGTDADDYDVPYFLSLGDNTTGSGNYLIVDADDI